MPEFSDRESVLAWAEGKPQEVLVAFSARSALRAYPGIIFGELVTPQEAALPIARLMLSTVVAGLIESPELVEACQSADPHVQKLPRMVSHTHDTGDAANYSASYASFVVTHSENRDYSSAFAAEASAHSALLTKRTTGEIDQHPLFWLAASGDASFLATNAPELTYGRPLWQEGSLDHDLDWRQEKLTAFWQSAPEVWGFWQRWYEGMLNGEPLPWELQEKVALIPEEDWEEGPERVAEVIRRIEAEFIGNTLKERIEFSVSGRLTLVAQPVGEERQLGYLLDTVQDALDLATAGLRNELPDDSYQARLLRRTFTRYANDPQRIEMDFERARVSLVEDMAAEAIPASAANRDLIQSLSDAAGSIRDSNPEIAESRDRLNRIRLAQVSPEQGAQIAEIAVQVAAISEDILREDLLEDRFRLPGVRSDDAVPDPVVPIGAAERNAALEAQAAQLRLYSRLTKVWLFLKENDREIAIVGSLASIIGLIVSVVVISS